MLTILGALCTALLSGVIAALATYSMNSDKEHVFLLRSKAEEVYICFESYFDNLAGYALGHYPFFKGEMSLPALMDCEKKRMNESGYDTNTHKKALMLSAIYFPQIDVDVNKLKSSLLALNNIITDAKSIAKINNNMVIGDKDTYLQFHNATGKLFSAMDAIRLSLVREARITANAEALTPPLVSAVKRRVMANWSWSPDGGS